MKWSSFFFRAEIINYNTYKFYSLITCPYKKKKKHLH